MVLVVVRVKLDPAPPPVTSPVTCTAGIWTDFAVIVPVVEVSVPLTVTKSPTATLGELTPGSLYFVELETSTVTLVPLRDLTVELVAVSVKSAPAPPDRTKPSTVTDR